MRRKIRRWCIGFGLLFLGGFVALNVIAYNQARTMMCFARAGSRTPPAESLSFPQKIKTLFCGVNIPRPYNAGKPEDLAPGSLAVKIPCADGPMLGAWYCPRPDAKDLVLLFHGYTGEKSSLITLGRAFLDMGCSVLLVDFRGSGESSESYTTVGYLEGLDVAAVVQYAKSNLPPARVVLCGESMGAAAILRAVYACDVKPDAIILEAVFDTLLHTVRNRFALMKVPSFPSAELIIFWGGRRRGFNGFAHNPVEYATRVTCPALFLHGGGDPRARLEEARAVFAAVRGPKQFKEFPAARHESGLSRFPDEWRAAVEQFLKSPPRQ